MASGSNKNRNRQLNRVESRRTGGTRTDLFDLRGDQESEEARPYRERHRVEVDANGYAGSQPAFRRSSGGSGMENDPADWMIREDYRENTGAGSGSGGRTPGLTAEDRDTGSRRTGSREISADLFVPSGSSGRGRRSRVTRVPRSLAGYGSYDNSRTTGTGYGRNRTTGTGYDRYGSGRNAGTGYDRYGSGRNAGTGYDGYGSGRTTGAGYDGYGSYGNGRTAGTEDSRYTSRRTTDRSYNGNGRATGSGYGSYGSGRTTGTGTGSGRTTGAGYDSYGSYGSGRTTGTGYGSSRTSGRGSGRYSADPYDPYMEDERTRRDPAGSGKIPERAFFFEEDLPEGDLSRQSRADRLEDDYSERRRQRRDQLRKEREKQIRQMHFRIGAAAAVVLVLLVLVIVAVVVKVRSGKEDQGQEAAAPAPAVAAGTADTEETQDGTGDGAVPPQDQEEESSEPGDDGSQTDSTGQAAKAEEADRQKAPPEETQDTEEKENGQETETAAAGDGQETQERSYSRQTEWNLILANPWHPLPEGYSVETTSLPNGESVDSRCYDDLMEMLTDCTKNGGNPVVCSSYRTHEKQIGLYEAQVKKHMDEGMDRAQAEKEAGKVVAVPGTSEHEVGLAVDLCDYTNQNLDESQAETVTQKWLMANSWKYGFILRYPVDKSDLTGIIYEPWHYRYVGKDIAAEIYSRGICLEEYLSQ